MLAGSRKFILISLFTAVLIALVNVAWWFYYQRTEQILDSQLTRRLSTVAAAGAVMIEPGQVELLLSGNLTAFAEVTARLADLQSTDSLATIFIVDNNYQYLTSTALEIDTAYFLANLNGRYIDSLFLFWLDRPVVTPSYRTGSLYLKTAFAPLHGQEGYVSAVLGVEANVDYFDVLEELRRNLLYASGLSLIGGIVLGFVFLLLQRRINQAEQQLFLGQTHAYLGRMVAVVSHELKNPLSIIRASAERLARKTEGPEAAYVMEEVDRLNQIVTGYLDFARADGRLLESDSKESFDLFQLIREVKQHFHDKYISKKITWLSDPEPAGTLIMTGYPRSLRQVLLNLLINGAEACQETGGEIAIGLQAEEKGGHIWISVVDKGPGFSPGEARAAFTPFHSTKRHGSGLGLYLSKKIVAEMGGSIKISSETGMQTKITVGLPKGSNS